jgi:hypothetical protein
MTNQHQREKPAPIAGDGQRTGVTAPAPGDTVDPLAGLSAAHLEACREAAKVDVLINLTLAYLLAKRAKK